MPTKIQNVELKSMLMNSSMHHYENESEELI